MKVSVVIPAFNAAEFIERAIKSALNQTHRDIELIIVDDGSSDNTYEIANYFQEIDSRVIVFQHKLSLGPSAARNTAIRRSTGLWVALLDADDEFLENRLEVMLNYAVSQNLDAVADNIRMINFDTREDIGPAFEIEWFIKRNNLTLDFFINHDWPGRYKCKAIGLIKPIIKKKILIDNAIFYDEDIRLGEDFLIYAKIIISEANFGLIEEALYLYGVRQSSMSKNPQNTKDLISVNDRILEYFRRRNQQPTFAIEMEKLLSKRKTALLWDVCYWAVKSGDYKKAISSFNRSDKIEFINLTKNKLMEKFFSKSNEI